MSTWAKVFLGACAVALLGAAGVVGTDYLLGRAEPQSARDAGERQAIRVGVTMPATREIEEVATAVGTVLPLRAVDLIPYAAGRVKRVPVASGQSVEQGDLILQLEDAAPRAALSRAEATLSEARQEFRRIEELADRNAAAEDRREEARANFERAEASVSEAEALVEDHRITAPFTGTLGFVDVEPGALLDMRVPISTLFDISAVEVEAELPERYFGRVEPGQRVDLTVSAYADRTFTGEVAVRAPVVDPASRNFTFRARIDNEEELLTGGMFADLRLVLGSYEGLAVSDDAIISEGLATYVFIVEDGMARRTEVVTGRSLGPLTEVESGLGPDDRVVVSGWDRLSDGASVEIADDIATEGLN